MPTTGHEQYLMKAHEAALRGCTRQRVIDMQQAHYRHCSSCQEGISSSRPQLRLQSNCWLGGEADSLAGNSGEDSQCLPGVKKLLVPMIQRALPSQQISIVHVLKHVLKSTEYYSLAIDRVKVSVNVHPPSSGF